MQPLGQIQGNRAKMNSTMMVKFNQPNGLKMQINEKAANQRGNLNKSTLLPENSSNLGHQSKIIQGGPRHIQAKGG